MSRRRTKGLTERQKNVLDMVEVFQNKNGYPPSIREIKDRVGISSTSVVNYYLEQLEEMGYIQRDNHVSRGIRLLKTSSSLSPTSAYQIKQTLQDIRQSVEEVFRIPVVGQIFASEPVPVPASDFAYLDEESSFINIASSMLPTREKTEGLYALRVKGDSMIDAMINDGDIVIMKPAQAAHNGELVAIWLLDKDETTLKYFYKENDRVRLQPANPTMNPIYINDPRSLRIQGKVVMVIRPVEIPVV